MPLRTRQLVMNDSVEKCPETFDFKPRLLRYCSKQRSRPGSRLSAEYRVRSDNTGQLPSLLPHWVYNLASRSPSVSHFASFARSPVCVALCEPCEIPRLLCSVLITLDIMTLALLSLPPSRCSADHLCCPMMFSVTMMTSPQPFRVTQAGPSPALSITGSFY